MSAAAIFDSSVPMTSVRVNPAPGARTSDGSPVNPSQTGIA